MRLAVLGASGRMGRAIIRLATAEGEDIVCAAGNTNVGRDVGELAGTGATGTCIVDTLSSIETARAQVVVDFSAANATRMLAPIAAAAGTAVVSGTTGLDEEARAALDAASDQVAVLWEPNMSLGMHVLARLVAKAAAALPDWDTEIIEVHHRAKVDSPSGTALRLADCIHVAHGSPARPVHGRGEKSGPRPTHELGIHAVRGGDVVGEHSVFLLGMGERLELVHRATSRDVFAYGALRAARWIAGRPAGRYTIDDVLGEAGKERPY